MNKINPFFSEIYYNKHIKAMTNIAIITQIWHGAKCHFACNSNTWYLITVPDMNKIITFFSEISQQTLKICEKIAIITQMWHRAKFYFMCISSPCHLIMVPNIKKIHRHHGGICKEGLTDGRRDRQTDWWTGSVSDIPRFWYCGVGNKVKVAKSWYNQDFILCIYCVNVVQCTYILHLLLFIVTLYLCICSMIYNIFYWGSFI